MVKTDGTPTVAWANPPEDDEHHSPKCDVLASPGNVTTIRLASNRATTENIAALRARHPNATIIIEAAA